MPLAAHLVATAQTPRGASQSPRSANVSPKSTYRKATAMFRKRQRLQQWREDDEDDEEFMAQDDGRWQSIHRHHHGPVPPLPPRRAHPYEPRRPTWSSVKVADHLAVEDHHDQDQDEEEMHRSFDGHHQSPFQEIQCRVDQVGAQVAQAQRDVAELRELLLQAVAIERRHHHHHHYHTPVHPTRRTSSAQPTGSRARVRIEHLCS